MYFSLSSLQSVLASYLGYPRINFIGQFRADTATRNNHICNYRDDAPYISAAEFDWDSNGTNEFQFVNTEITSVVYENGSLSVRDSIVGHSTVGNLDQPIAKISSPNNQHCGIFGMMFGIQWKGEDDSTSIAFHGDWTPNVITQYQWARTKCYDSSNYGNYTFQVECPLNSHTVKPVLSDHAWAKKSGL